MRKRMWQGLRLIGLLAAFALLIYLFRDTDPYAVWLSLIDLDPIYLIPVIIGMIGMPVSRALRLRCIMASQTNIGHNRMFAVYNVGQMLNVVLPALTGQVGRVLLFSRTLGITKTFALTTVILEVLFDGVVLVMMIFAASFLVVMPDWMVRGEVFIMMACLLLIGFFYLILHRHRRPGRSPSRLRRRLPRRLVQEMDNVKASFLAGLDMLTSTRHLFLTVFLSVVSWVAHALIVLSLLHAFGIKIPFWGAILVLTVNTLVIMVPISPGNVGTFQLACIAGLGLIGVPKEEALAFSIPLHLAELGPVFILGALSSFSAHVSLREYMDRDVLEEEDRLAKPLGDGVGPESAVNSEEDTHRETLAAVSVPAAPAQPDRGDS